MARTKTITNLKKSVGLLAITATLALAACGQGDGKPGIQNSPVTPLPPVPAGFCDPINFEIVCESPEIINFNGGATEVVDNPDRSGINDSERVARMQKFADETFGGTRLNPVETPVDFSDGEVYKIKVWSERSVPVTFKLEETNDGTLGVERVDVHDGGSTWQELCFDFTGVTPANTIGLTIIFDNGVLGQAIAGVFAGDWTFYYDDIEQAGSCSPTGAATGEVPDASLYDPAGSPDLVAGTDYTEITPFGSGSVIDPVFADDDTFSPALAVTSGAGYGANVAQIGYIGFPAGFLTDYEEILFKAKGLPNAVIFVKLFDQVDSVRINLTSSGFSEDLGDGWFQVAIPLTEFTGLTTATGLVLESDNTAPAQFMMLLNDIGFNEPSNTGGGGGGGGGGTQSLGVYSETNDNPNVNITDIVSAGNPVTIDTSSTAVTAFEGAVSLALTFSDNTAGNFFGGAVFNFDNADLTAFDTLKFAIDTSQFANLANLTVQLEPPGSGASGTFIFLADYSPVSTSGDWEVYEIPLADYTAVNPAVVQRLGFFNARDGSDTLLAGTLYLDDIHFTVAAGGGGGGGGGGTAGLIPDDVIYATDPGETVDLVTTITAFGTSSQFEGAYALDPDFNPSFEALSGSGYGLDHIVQLGFVDLPAGFATGYESFLFKIKSMGLPGNAIEVKLEGGGSCGVITLSDTNYSTPLGNDWFQVVVPMTDCAGVATAVGILFERVGAQTADGGVAFGFLVTDIGFNNPGSGGGGGGGGGNMAGLAVNGDFETGDFSSWQQFVNSGVQSISSDTPTNGGSFSAALSGNTAPGNGGTTEIKQANLGVGTLALGDTLTISFDVKGTFGPAGQLNVLSFTEFSGGGGTLSDQKVYDAASGIDDWTSVSYDVTLSGPDAGGGFSLAFNPVCGAVADCVANVFIDNVSIVVQ